MKTSFPCCELIFRLRELGFETGWGDTAERVKETMRLLSESLQAPYPMKLQLLFSRIPNMFNIVIFSPHGYFGQSDVLGLPDTGGQVCKTILHTTNYGAIIIDYNSALN
jgi:hypothetical protein